MSELKKITIGSGVMDVTELPNKAPLPKGSYSRYGSDGQVLRSHGDGTTEWASVGQPTDSQTATAVTAWLNAHPEATTTVQDGSLGIAKFATDAMGYVSFKQFGAAGDGTTNDYSKIVDCVAYANLHKMPIVNFDGKYYAEGADTIELKTSVYNSSSVEFILGDTFIKEKPLFVFSHESEYDDVSNVLLSTVFTSDRTVSNQYANKAFVITTGIAYGVNHDNASASDEVIEECVYANNTFATIYFEDYSTAKNRTVSITKRSSMLEQGYVFDGGTVRKKTTGNGACFIKVNRNNCTVRNIEIRCDRTSENGNVIYLYGANHTLIENILCGSSSSNNWGYEISAYYCADLVIRNVTGYATRGQVATRTIKDYTLENSKIKNYDVHWNAFGMFVVDKCVLGEEAHLGYGNGQFIVRDTSCNSVSFRATDYTQIFRGKVNIVNCQMKQGLRILCNWWDDATRDGDFFIPVKMPSIHLSDCTFTERNMSAKIDAGAISEGMAERCGVVIENCKIVGYGNVTTTSFDNVDTSIVNCTFTNETDQITNFKKAGTVNLVDYSPKVGTVSYDSTKLSSSPILKAQRFGSVALINFKFTLSSDVAKEGKIGNILIPVGFRPPRSESSSTDSMLRFVARSESGTHIVSIRPDGYLVAKEALTSGTNLTISESYIVNF